MQKTHTAFEEVVLAACTAYINEGGAMQEWPAGTANGPRRTCKHLQTVTPEVQIIPVSDSKVRELLKVHEAEGERGKSERYFCNPWEISRNM